MSRSIERRRLENKYGVDRAPVVDMMYGDDDALGIMEEMMKMAMDEKAKDEAKNVADKKAVEDKAANAPKEAAIAEAKAAKARAVQAAADAHTAKLAADAKEKDPNGPLHIAARKAAAQVKPLDDQAKAASDKVTYFQSPDVGEEKKHGKEGMKTDWKTYLTPKNMWIGGGVALGLVLVAKLLRKR